MKLDVGMYVRTKCGIGKLLYFNEELEEWVNEEYNYYTEDYIVKASHNIIDLIEVGDYVNEIKVGYINKGENYFYALTDENTREIICGYDSDGFTKPLNSILTKEQMEVNQYKVV